MFSSRLRLDTSTQSSLQVSLLLSRLLLFYTYICLCYFSDVSASVVINFFVFWSIRLRSSLVYFKNGPESVTSKLSRCFVIYWDFSWRSNFKEFFSCSPEFPYIFFLSLLSWWFLLSQLSITRNFPSLQEFWSFLGMQFYSLYCFSFPVSHYQHFSYQSF